MQASQETAGSAQHSFPRPQDTALARLSKDNKALQEANEILKNQPSSSRTGNHRKGVPVYESQPGALCHYKDGSTFGPWCSGVR